MGAACSSENAVAPNTKPPTSNTGNRTFQGLTGRRIEQSSDPASFNETSTPAENGVNDLTVIAEDNATTDDGKILTHIQLKTSCSAN